jgi:hypothetical protein
VYYTPGRSSHSSPKIYQIIYEKFKFTGILQVDEEGTFFIKCRNIKRESMEVCSIPEKIIDEIKEIDEYVPYSVLRKIPISKERMVLINTQLK